MLKRKMQKVKNSRLIALPAQLCDMFGIVKGDLLGIEVEKNKIIITPVAAAKQGTGVTGAPLKEAPI